MLTVAEAQAAILAECTPNSVVAVSLTTALGQVLAQPVVSPYDSPPFDKSMMDGFAVRVEELTAAGTVLPIVGELIAGPSETAELLPGTTLRIMTGAPIPRGCNAVVRLEDVTVQGALSDQGELAEFRLGAVPVGRNIIPRGQMLRRGETVLTAACQLRPQEIALLAEMGRDQVAVHRRPSAAVLATGDELVPPGVPLGPGQICNSNESLLVAQLTAFGAEVRGLGIGRDDLSALREKITEGLRSDVLILTGGVSMGSRDLVPQVLTESGARPVFHKVQLKPGKPVWFGVLDDPATGRRTLIFALPGNPVSSMVCSELFVRPAIARLLGLAVSLPPLVTARLTREHLLREDRPTYFPAWLSLGGEGAMVEPTDWRGSADLRSTVHANAVIAFPAAERTYDAGETVTVWPFVDAVGTAARSV
ncbi:MAG: gephyrin-like molybdotransferase Glp [Planctomycetaceae bacterium]